MHSKTLLLHSKLILTHSKILIIRVQKQELIKKGASANRGFAQAGV